MAKRSNGRIEELRSMVAQEAARLMAEEWLSDFGAAKRKAAARLGVTDRAALPSNQEIETALHARQRLFGGEARAATLRDQRRQARAAMLLLEEFDPRLVGTVLKGTATEHSEISLHLFADAPESVALRLMEHGIPFDTAERRVRYTSERTEYRPLFRFQAGAATIAATVFPVVGVRQSPLSPVDGKPMRRARLEEVDQLLDEEAGSSGPPPPRRKLSAAPD